MAKTPNGKTPSYISDNDSPVMAAPLTEKGKLFWNAYTNIQNDIKSADGYDFSREQLTYIQADERYVDYVQLYLNSTDMMLSERDVELEKAKTAHIASAQTLDETPGYDTDMAGLANDFYFVIEQNYDSLQPVPAITDTASQTEVASGADSAFDLDFAQTQLGDLAATPKEAVVLATTPIKPEDAPLPLLWTQEMPIREPETILTAALEETPSINFFEENKSTTSDYEVKSGDNLWNIAKDHYGLTKNADIMKAVTAIANANSMEEGTMANHLRMDQVIKLPDSPTPDATDKPLDWRALDAETAQRKGLTSSFTPAAQGREIIAPVPLDRPQFAAAPAHP